MIALSACSAQPVDRTKLNTAPHFWQKVTTTAAIYQRGPKAQQMLNRDISRCLIDIRELERLGTIRRATPAATPETGETPASDSSAGVLASWETPERDGMLRAEHTEYHDFETCMISKGWERVEHVPYDVAETGRETYVETILGQQYRSKRDKRPSIIDIKPKEFSTLND